MAEQGQIPVSWTLESGADLRTEQHKGVAIDANGRAILCGGSQNKFVGVLQNKPNSLEHANVGMIGVSKGVAGVAITLGDYVRVQSGFFFPGQRAVPDTNTLSGDAAITNAGSGVVLVGMALSTVASGGKFNLGLGIGFYSIVNSN
jgi:hypothetical protein